MNKNLIPFGYKNKNNRLYNIESYNWGNIINNSEIYGELHYPNMEKYMNINMENVSHKINNIKLYDDGLWGDIEILDTPNGKILEQMINNGIDVSVRCRGLGTVDNNGIVKLTNIITFDAILNDAFDIDNKKFRKEKIISLLNKIKING